jgi:tetratricopeptide (TPR) repeat protein
MKHLLPAVCLAVLLALILSSVTSADIAPPQQPPGFNPEPGNEITQVRMLAETVTIDVLTVDPPQAHFSAIFTMRNLGNSTEEMAVRFPIAASDGWSSLLEIENVAIMVNDQSTAYKHIEGPEPIYGFEDKSVPWASFSVSFPPGEDVMISVSYDLDGTSYDYETYTNFYYILQTGAGWKDTIGSGEIILRLPYDASPLNVILDDPQDTNRNSWQGTPQFNGREVHWTFTELEPTPSDNITFDIVKPVIWRQVVTGLENTSQNPQDGEAWGYLGKAYKQALFASGKGYPRVDAAAIELYQLSKEAYEQAIKLKPEDGLWHAGFAELLLDEYYWVSWNDRSYTAELDLGLRELSLAVQLAPKASKVKELVEEYSYMLPDYIVRQSDGSLDFLSLTQTPTPAITIETPGPTRTVSSTPSPATATPHAEDTSQPASPLCGGVALIFLPLVLINWKSRIKN